MTVLLLDLLLLRYKISVRSSNNNLKPEMDRFKFFPVKNEDLDSNPQNTGVRFSRNYNNFY